MVAVPGTVCIMIGAVPGTAACAGTGFGAGSRLRDCLGLSRYRLRNRYWHRRRHGLRLGRHGCRHWPRCRLLDRRWRERRCRFHLRRCRRRRCLCCAGAGGAFGFAGAGLGAAVAVASGFLGGFSCPGAPAGPGAAVAPGAPPGAAVAPGGNCRLPAMAATRPGIPSALRSRSPDSRRMASTTNTRRWPEASETSMLTLLGGQSAELILLSSTPPLFPSIFMHGARASGRIFDGCPLASLRAKADSKLTDANPTLCEAAGNRLRLPRTPACLSNHSSIFGRGGNWFC